MKKKLNNFDYTQNLQIHFTITNYKKEAKKKKNI